MKTQFIMNQQGKKVGVILPIKDYEKLLDEIDELACVKAYDRVTSKKMTFVPALELFKAIEKNRK